MLHAIANFVSSLSAHGSGVATTVCLASAVVIALRFLKRKPKSHGYRTRSTSIGSSRLMCSGVLPKGSPYDSIINMAVTFDNMPALDAIKVLFRDHVVPYERFHSIPHQETDCGPITWICQKVNVDDHFMVHEVPATGKDVDGLGMGGLANARRHIESLLNKTLTTKAQRRPWWEVHYICVQSTGAKQPGILLIRVHHCLGDGISLSTLFSDIMRDENGTVISERFAEMFSPTRMLKKTKPSVNPLSILSRAVSVVQAIGTVLLLTMKGEDSPCAYQNSKRLLPYEPNRFTVYFPTHSLSLIKSIKNFAASQTSRSITINDVEFALYAGCLRRFALRHGEDPNNLILRALTPFAVPERIVEETKYRTSLRNYWTFVVNQLPVASGDAMQRIIDSNRSWDRLKSTALIPVSFALHALSAKILPPSAQKDTANELMRRVSTVFSNVPGPQCRLFFGGEEATAVHMLFPNLAHQVGIISFGGWLNMALVISTSVDPVVARRELVECFVEELTEAAEMAGVTRATVMKEIKIIH